MKKESIVEGRNRQGLKQVDGSLQINVNKEERDEGIRE
jgi:hypothetical protein